MQDEKQMAKEFLFPEVTEKIIQAFYIAYSRLGYGFLERVYEKALMIELGKMGLLAVAQAPITVLYDGVSIGEYFADVIVEEKIIVEIKAAKHLTAEHEAQLLNYLKASKIEVGLVLNFGPKPQFKRKAFQNDGKYLVK